MVAAALFSAFLAAPLPQASAQPARKASRSGDIADLSLESKIVNRKVDIWVWTPPGYKEASSRKYPLLIMHDGQNVFDGAISYIPNGEWRADETAGSLISAGLMEPVVIAGVSNGLMNRADEYLPTRSRRGTSEMGGGADAYGRCLTEEVMPFLAKQFRLDLKPSRTGLVGSSFGGIVTLHLGLSRPDAFGRLGVISPSLWWDNKVMLRRAESASFKGRKWWVDMGTAEGPGAAADARKLGEIMAASGLKSGRDFVYVEENGGEHNEFAWARRLGSIFTFLYPARR